jgi:hypothetical protein
MNNHHRNHAGNHAADFAQLGTVFNDATARLVGGVTTANSDKILADLQKVQTGLEQLMAKQPDMFQGESGIHARNIIDQLNLETQAIKTVGTDPYAAKFINDVQRDLIDIVQGDAALSALATQHGANGFAAVPGLLVPPKPFQGNAEQTDFMKKFVVDAQSLSDKAVALADAHAAPDSAATVQLISDAQSFLANTNSFTVAQGGLYSARFNNEFALDGVNGTATRALVHGLQTGNADEVHAAANVLAANAADVSTNMLGLGGTPVVTQAGTIFNDASAKLIGGVYDGVNHDGNRQSILNDLNATRTGLQELMAQHPDQYQGATGQHVQSIVALLGQEVTAVQNVGTDPAAMNTINGLHKAILNIVQHDTALKTASTDGDTTGFMALPKALHGQGGGHGNGQGGGHHDNGHIAEVVTDHGAAMNVAAAAIQHDHTWG